MGPKSSLILFTVLLMLFNSGAVVLSDIVKLNATQTTYVEVNTSLVLSCSYEGNSTPKTCFFWRNDSIYTAVSVQKCIYTQSPNFTVTCVEINKVVFTLLRTGVEEHGVKWTCSFKADTEIKSEYTEIKVKVPVSSVMLSSPNSSQVTLAENSIKEFRCETSASRPIPALSWYMDDNTPTTTDDLTISQIVSQSPAAGSEDFVVTTGSLTYKASRLANGKYVFCQSRDDDGNTVVSNRRILLNVTYKPDRGPLITNYSNNIIYYAITNKPQVLTCTITGGNPLASISWSCFIGKNENLSSGQMVSMKWTWRASSNGTCTCVSTHLGADENVMLNVAILSPPTHPKFTLHSQTVEGKTTVKIIRDSTEPITCTAESFPAPDKYTWKYDGQSSPLSQVASLYPSKISADGRYFCEVGNTMSPSLGQVEYGNSTNYVDIERLFSPLVTTFSIGPVVEGDPFSVECKTVPGNPASTTYSWQRKLHSERWTSLPSWNVSGSHLTKQQISRHDAGIYKCTASNTMKPTAEQQQIGSSSETFILNVLYKTSISWFIELNHSLSQEVTVSEHSSIHLQCEVDSNPGSTINISKEGEIKVSMENRQQISFINSKVACDTAGTYTCNGYNAYNIGENKPSKDLKLFVTCSPRLSTMDDFKKNITSPLEEEAILKISIMAYPVPKESDYTWWKWNGKMWDQVKTGNNIHINTSGLESSVIFHSVLETDYQRYRLNVSNDYGHFHQEVFLNPYGTPELPKNVGFNEESVSQSTVQISWNPGFNGGLEQTFVVLYKKNKESTWLHVTKVDEKTERMNVTLKELDSGTTYEFQMYSRNSLGNSSQTEMYTFNTLEMTTKGQVPAALIGGAVGGSVVVIILIAVIVVVFLRKSNFKKGKSKNASDRSDMKPVYEDDGDDGMQDNPMYVSAGPRNVNSNTGACSSEGAVEYSTVNKAVKTIDTVNDNEYAVVSKPKQAQTKPGKKEKKHGFFKDKKGKGAVPEGDVYENSPASEMKVVIKKEETIYDNHEASVQKKNVNKDGLLYADLSFNDQQKGQRKLVIHGLDSMTEYVEVDFTKKADPLPDSDDENIPPKN